MSRHLSRFHLIIALLQIMYRWLVPSGVTCISYRFKYRLLITRASISKRHVYVYHWGVGWFCRDTTKDQQCFDTLVWSYYSDSGAALEVVHGILVVYDVTCPESLCVADRLRLIDLVSVAICRFLIVDFSTFCCWIFGYNRLFFFHAVAVCSLRRGEDDSGHHMWHGGQG